MILPKPYLKKLKKPESVAKVGEKTILHFELLAIFLGLVFGSFGSVILSRRGDSESLEQASSILRGRSECPQCKKRLQPGDLIPVISFLLQK